MNYKKSAAHLVPIWTFIPEICGRNSLKPRNTLKQGRSSISSHRLHFGTSRILSRSVSYSNWTYSVTCLHSQLKKILNDLRFVPINICAEVHHAASISQTKLCWSMTSTWHYLYGWTSVQLEWRLYGICPEVLVLLFTTSKYKLLVVNATWIVYSIYKPSKSRAAYFYLVLSRI